MEQTKVWVVELTRSMSFMGSSFPVRVFLSQEDADFYVWTTRQDRGDGLYRDYYSAKEVEVGVVDKTGKDFVKFKAEKLKEIDKAIEKRAACADEDEAAMARLRKEREHYA
jgi:hypothetical protein